MVLRAVAAGTRLFRRRRKAMPRAVPEMRVDGPACGASPCFYFAVVASPSSAASAISASLCPKTGHFGIPNPEKRPSVPQNLPFWDPDVRKTRLRAQKHAILGSRTWKISPSLGKTGTFAHPRQGKQHSVGQNRHFCPSAAGKKGKGGSRSQGGKG